MRKNLKLLAKLERSKETAPIDCDFTDFEFFFLLLAREISEFCAANTKIQIEEPFDQLRPKRNKKCVKAKISREEKEKAPSNMLKLKRHYGCTQPPHSLSKRYKRAKASKRTLFVAFNCEADRAEVHI